MRLSGEANAQQQIRYLYNDIAEYERDRLHREISRRQGKLTQRITFDALGRMTNKRTAFNDLFTFDEEACCKKVDIWENKTLISES